MSQILRCAFLLTLLWAFHECGAQTRPPAASAKERSAMNTDGGDCLLMGGVGGVYFLAEPGELTVEVEKRDRNRANVRTELRAVLAGPDRRVVQEATIPDDGQPMGSGLGPLQRCRLSTRVERKGIYALNITVSQDRYGVEAVWGIRTNCPKYLVETARGHKDERHQEPVVLASPGRAGDVCFMPRRGAFGLEVSGLPKAAASPQVFDARGALVAALQVDAKGQATQQFAANVHRDAVPWRLHFPSAQATVSIDGVTRWESDDLQRDMACWTPDPKSWFPFVENRWLLTPYSRTVYGQPGQQVQIALLARNDALRERTIQLGVEFPDAAWPVQLPSERVVIPARQTTPLVVTCTVPDAGQTRMCHVRATPLDDSDVSTYSTLTVKAGEAPAAKRLAMPLALKAYQHENEQFGYLPDYPVESQIYFDLGNRPFVRISGGVAAWRDGQWATALFSSAVKSRTPAFEGDSFGTTSTKIAFDRDNDLYALATVGRIVALLHSTDGGQTFSAYVIAGREDRPRAFDIEQFSGQNVPDGPPPIVRFTRTAKDEKLIWRSLNDLELFTPRKVDGRLVMGEPVLISDKCIG
ncbi:MAG: hypothetical protein FJ272_16310, partial [Planctomycetes bacterium]|nr:hypothetical protein [Planctomycetota bacterium]